MGIRVLADGRLKLTAVETEPANPAAPTAAELNAGVDLSCNVLQDGFTFGATDSDKIQEKALCTVGNSNSLGPSNAEVGFTVWRYFDEAGGFDVADDEAFELLKEKGTTLWLYARQMDKLATAAWAATDEIYFGAEVVTDTPQRVDTGGFIKYRIPCEVQNSWAFSAVGAGA
jgi:hypothetical protein